MTFIADKKDWVMYADIVGDNNLLHRDDNFAKKHGLEGVVAPGMWLASHLQGLGKIQKIESKFRNPAYDGDIVTLDGYSFSKGDEVVCSNKVILGAPTGRNISLPGDIVYSQGFSASEEDIQGFLESIGSNAKDANLEMYLMSCSAPAMLGYGASAKLTGAHISQSIEIYKPFDVRDVRVSVQEDSVRPGRSKLNLYWESAGEVVAMGEAKVLSKDV
jgi:hypothetical protein